MCWFQSHWLAIRSLFQKHITAASIVQACRALSVDSTSTEDGNSSFLDLAASLQESDVIVSFAVMHFGMKEKTPLDSIRFYWRMIQLVSFSSYTYPSWSKEPTINEVIIRRRCHSDLRKTFFGSIPWPKSLNFSGQFNHIVPSWLRWWIKSTRRIPRLWRFPALRILWRLHLLQQRYLRRKQRVIHVMLVSLSQLHLGRLLRLSWTIVLRLCHLSLCSILHL